jgi:hypothetical protein
MAADRLLFDGQENLGDGFCKKANRADVGGYDEYTLLSFVRADEVHCAGYSATGLTWSVIG